MASGFPIFVTHVGEAEECPERTTHCSIIFWGQKDRNGMAAMQEKLAEISPALNVQPAPSISELKKAPCFCIQVNNAWLRGRVDQSLTISTGANLIGLVDVFCVDYGFMQHVPQNLIRMFPDWCAELRDHPPMAHKFLLGDVLVEKSLKFKEFCIRFLKTNMVNQFVCASHLGHNSDYEGVRLYTGKGELVARILVDKGLVTMADSYSEAIKASVPDVKTLIPSHAPTLKTALAAPVHRPSNANDNAVAFISSSLDLESECLVVVSGVQNGVHKFTVQKKCPEVDRTRCQLNQDLKRVEELKPLVNPSRGTACIVVGEDEALFRGLVSEVRANNIYFVYLVDQGDFEAKPLGKLFEIPSNLMTTPLLSIRVSLAESDQFDRFGTTAAEAFSSLALNNTFTAKVPSGFSSTPPQKLQLFDSEGRNIKDLLLAILNPASGHPPGTAGIPLSVSRSEVTEIDPNTLRSFIKIPNAELEKEEALFVTYCDELGQFFGQLDKRPTAELKALEKELFSFYGNSADKPLLYSDLGQHLGDHGVIKWADDGNLYRVEVIEEVSGNGVLVRFVDYGNVVEVSRPEIWAPMAGLKMFSLPAIGVLCRIENISHVSRQQWQDTLINKPLKVIFGSPSADGQCYTVHLPDCMVNSSITAALKTNGKEPYPVLTPCGAPPPFPIGASVSNAVGSTRNDTNWTNGIDVGFPSNFTRPAESSGSSVASGSAGTRNKDDWNSLMASFGRPIGGAAGSSVTNSRPASRSDFENVEARFSPTRVLPIAEPPPPSEKYSLMPVITGAMVDVTVGVYQNVAKFFLSPENLPDHSVLEELESYYSALSSLQMIEKEPQVGLPCVVRYTVDKSFYRSEITKLDDRTAEILFVDYGNSQKTPLGNVRRMDSKFMGLPQMAWRCHLNGVHLKNPVTADKQHHIDTCFYPTKLVARFHPIDRNGSYPVDLDAAGLGDVATYLVQQGVVERAAVEVYVAFAEGPDQFWLQKKSDEVDIGHLATELAQLYDSPNSASVAPSFRPTVGSQLYAARYSDNWYRVQLMLIKDSAIAEAYFVDYGDSHEVPLVNLRPLPNKWLSASPFAARCRLQVPNKPNQWSQGIVEFFKRSCNPNIIFKAVFSVKEGDFHLVESLASPTVDIVTEVVKMLSAKSASQASSHAVSAQPIVTLTAPPSEPQSSSQRDYIPDEIISSTASVQVCTSAMDVWVQFDPQALTSLEERIGSLERNVIPVTSASAGDKCLVSYGMDWCRAVVESVNPSGALGIRYMDYGNYDTVLLDKVRKLPDSLVQIPPMAIKCALDGCEGKPLTMHQCQAALFHKQNLTVKVVKTTADHLFVRFIDAKGVDLNASLGLPISAAPSRRPSDIVIPGEEVVHVSFVSRLDQFWIQKDIQAIQDMQSTLQLVAREPPVTELKVGQNYAVLHPVYDKWYRARVDQSGADGHLVTFIDYGDVQKVYLSAFRLLPPMTRYIPPMASPCSFRQALAPLPLDPETIERLRIELEKCTDGIPCRIVMSPDKNQEDRFLVDSLFAGAVDVIATLKNNCNSPTTGDGSFARQMQRGL